MRLRWIYGILYWCCALAWAAEPFSVAVIDVKPWAMESKPGAYGGIYVDAARVIAQEAGYPLRFKLLPYLRVPLEVASGGSAFTIVSDNDDLNASSIKVGLIQQLPLVAIPRSNAGVTQLSDLQHKRIAVLRGTTYHTQLAGILSADFTPVEHYEQAFQMLLMNRVDAVLGVDQGLKYMVQSSPSLKSQQRKFGAPIGLTLLDAYLYVSPKLPLHQLLEIKRAYHAAKSKRLFDSVFNSY